MKFLSIILLFCACGETSPVLDSSCDLAKAKDVTVFVESLVDDSELKFCGDRTCDSPRENMWNCFKDCGPGFLDQWQLLPDYIDPRPWE